MICFSRLRELMLTSFKTQIKSANQFIRKQHNKEKMYLSIINIISTYIGISKLIMLNSHVEHVVLLFQHTVSVAPTA